MKLTNLTVTAAGSGGHYLIWLSRVTLALALLLCPFAIAPVLNFDSGAMALAAGGNGGGGGGGKPDTPGNGQGDLYSDLIVKYRSAQGLPIYIGVPEGAGEENGQAPIPEGFVACQQPVCFVIEDNENIDTYVDSVSGGLANPMINLADGLSVSPIPLGGTGIAGEECDVMLNPEDFTPYIQEVHFGRLNLGRSADRVLAQQLRDVTAMLSSGLLSWDAAGRIVAGEFTVDSPLQSLAIHRELLVNGFLTSQTRDAINLPELTWNGTNADYLDYAAAALGAAGDKGYFDIPGLINLDLVVYNNRILDIPNLAQDAGVNPVLTGDGLIGANKEVYYHFFAYQYDRGAKYPGCFKGITLGGDPVSGTIMNVVFKDVGFAAPDIYGFATAADDSRRVIAFVHETETIIVLEVDVAGSTDVCDG